MTPRFEVRVVAWEAAKEALREVREAVFVKEQHVPLELEWDGLDDGCLHALASDAQGRPIGTARLLADGHIGRMAVLKTWRGRGVGSALLRLLLDQARRAGMHEVRLNAQTYATGFYEKFGFRVVGEDFMDAGIPHREMVLELGDTPTNA